MGRPREFDEAEVIAAARDAFWEHGYAATGVAQLSEATGLSTGSLYKAFGSKAELCQRTLDEYLDAGVELVEATLKSGDTPLDGVERWLDTIAHHASQTGPQRGCYAVVCTTELAPNDPAIRARLQRHDESLRALVTDALRSAVAAGELHGDPVAGARLLATTVNGVQVDARKGISFDDARATLRLALDALR